MLIVAAIALSQAIAAAQPGTWHCPLAVGLLLHAGLSIQELLVNMAEQQQLQAGLPGYVQPVPLVYCAVTNNNFRQTLFRPKLGACARFGLCTECVKTCRFAAEEHLAGLAEWQEPQAGMFAWLKLCGGIQDADEILDKLKEEKVVVVPGSPLISHSMLSISHLSAHLSVCPSVCVPA